MHSQELSYEVMATTCNFFVIAGLVAQLDAAAPGFNSLIPPPSVPTLISTKPVELLCRASNISTMDPFFFVKQKTENG